MKGKVLGMDMDIGGVWSKQEKYQQRKYERSERLAEGESQRTCMPCHAEFELSSVNDREITDSF